MTHPTATLDEVWALFKETDRKFQETDRLITEKFQESERLIRELSKKIEETRSEIGKLGNRLGEFVEGLIKPSVVKLFQERGIEVHKVLCDIEIYLVTRNVFKYM